jgi:hypothetical protein
MKPIGIYTLSINDYAPEITRYTFPFMRYFAAKIGADFHVITERKFPDWPIPCEKWQLYELSQKHERRWTIFFDGDVLVHPELINFTNFMSRDYCANNGCDMAAVRVNYDKYFLRDGRNIGTCGWCIIASDWTNDIFRPPDDLKPEDCLERCSPIMDELRHITGNGHPHCVVDKPHLVDDFVMSRNVAKYGLKYTTLMELWKKVGFTNPGFFQHPYMITNQEKAEQLEQVLFGSPAFTGQPASVCPRCGGIMDARGLEFARPHYCGWKIPLGLSVEIDALLIEHMNQAGVHVHSE